MHPQQQQNQQMHMPQPQIPQPHPPIQVSGAERLMRILGKVTIVVGLVFAVVFAISLAWHGLNSGLDFIAGLFGVLDTTVDNGLGAIKDKTGTNGSQGGIVALGMILITILGIIRLLRTGRSRNSDEKER